MKRFAALLLAVSAFAAEAPTLTDGQKLAIVQAQRDLVALQAEQNALESRLKDIYYKLLPQAQQRVEIIMKNAAPAGYSVQPDLTLRAEPAVKPEEHK